MSTPTEVADVVIEFTADYADRNSVAVEMVKALGLSVDTIDDDDGVITGTAPADRLAAIRALPCVANLRVVDAYMSDVPARPDAAS